jgi:chorismate synthase
LKSVNIETKQEMTAEIVRSDVCPVASAAVIGEAVTAIALAQALKEKFGSDSLREMQDHLTRYREHLAR